MSTKFFGNILPFEAFVFDEDPITSNTIRKRPDCHWIIHFGPAIFVASGILICA
jgi:hypothetical protein